MFYFEVIGKPQGKARARVTKWGAYTPEKTVLYENLVKLSFQEQNPKLKPTEKPLFLNIVAVFEPTKSTSKKNYKLMLEGKIEPTKKPDIDNICKIILDSLNGVAYKDDIQVVGLNCRKIYGESSKVTVSANEVSYE